ncbi:MAG: hypothetical protein EZS28_021666 [Streblomastix strix]|uniref:Uncharacterized protein n=1 Tax=Streblomastix strix TaxID=222440 RepID=A0A5J4VK26_9EUKA|nr:MAG: hypothetical protein EZS28_021666 [Streblomastix strix]
MAYHLLLLSLALLTVSIAHNFSVSDDQCSLYEMLQNNISNKIPANSSKTTKNIDYTNSIVWKRRSLSIEGNKTYIIYDDREFPEDVVNVDTIPNLQSTTSVNDISYLVDPLNTGYKNFTVEQGYLKNFTDGCRSYRDMLSYGQLIDCHVGRVKFITDEDPEPESIGVMGGCDLHVDETIFLHPIIPQTCLDPLIGTHKCEKYCDGGSQLCELVTGIRVAELMQNDDAFLKKVLLKIGPIQLIEIGKLESLGFCQGIVIYGWHYSRELGTEFWDVMYHNMSAYTIFTQLDEIQLKNIHRADRILVYTSDQKSFSTCGHQDTETKSQFKFTEGFLLAILAIVGTITVGISVLLACFCKEYKKFCFAEGNQIEEYPILINTNGQTISSRLDHQWALVE